MFILTYGFRSFSSWSVSSIVLGPVGKQNIVQGPLSNFLTAGAKYPRSTNYLLSYLLRFESIITWFQNRLAWQMNMAEGKQFLKCQARSKTCFYFPFLFHPGFKLLVGAFHTQGGSLSSVNPHNQIQNCAKPTSTLIQYYISMIQLLPPTPHI